MAKPYKIVNGTIGDIINNIADELVVPTKNQSFTGSIFTITSSYITPAGSINNGSGYYRTEPINIKGASRLKIHTNNGSASASAAVFFNADNAYISGISGSTVETDMEVEVPYNAVYVIMSIRGVFTNIFTCVVDYGETVSVKESVIDLRDRVKVLEDDTQEVEILQEIGDRTDAAMSQKAVTNELLVSESETLNTSGIFTEAGFIRVDGSVSTSTAYRYTQPVDISGVNKLQIHLQVGADNVSTATFYDENNQWISGNRSAAIGEEIDMEIDVPVNAKYVVFNSQNAYISIFRCVIYKQMSTKDAIIDLYNRVKVLENQITSI